MASGHAKGLKVPYIQTKIRRSLLGDIAPSSSSLADEAELEAEAEAATFCALSLSIVVFRDFEEQIEADFLAISGKSESDRLPSLSEACCKNPHCFSFYVASYSL